MLKPLMQKIKLFYLVGVTHTHSVYTGNRSDEYLQRIKGVSYQEIANNGGGILKSSRQIVPFLRMNYFLSQ